MKINSTSKFIPSLFNTGHQDIDDFQTQTIPTPFRPIQNVILKEQHKNNRKNKALKIFLDVESQEQVQNPPEASITIETVTTAETKEQEQAVPSLFDGFKQSKMLMLSGNMDISSSEQSQKCQEITETEYQEMVQMPAIKDIDKVSQNQNNCQDNDKQQKKQESEQIKTPSVKSNHEETQLITINLFQTIKNDLKRCILRRDKHSSSGFVEYNLYLQGSLQHLLTVRKEGVWQYCLYLRQRPNNSDFFTYTKIASLESNFLGNKYTLIKTKEKYSNVTICYETNFLGLSGPRKFFVYLPKAGLPYEYLNECYENGKHCDKIEKCVSRTAKWNEKLQSYVLNLSGRASESSIKNFVVTDAEQRQQNNFIIFGKVGPDVYNLDIQSPFSMIQGVAVALTAFQRKITCD